MIDLCVVNYNTRPLLQRLLDTLHAEVSPENKFWNLYIADNDSADDTVEWLRENDKRYQIDRIDLNKNIGYSAAINKLASRGDNSVIGILNADVWFTNEDIKKYVKFLIKNQTYIFLGQSKETNMVI